MTAAPHDPVGRVVATEPRPATPHLFHFQTAPGSPVGIGAIVRVDGPGRTVFGIVTDAVAYADPGETRAPLSEGDGPPERRLYTAAVLRQLPEEPLQPVPLGPVRLADDPDIEVALRLDAFLRGPQPTGIPLGVYTAAGLEAPIRLDADFLLGPEAAHLSVTGVSGLATKTSAAVFLISSIFQSFPAHRGRVAAVCFNVKGPDLCFLDQPGALSEEDLRLYARLGLDATPFRDVQYYVPFRSDGVNLNTLRSNEALQGNTRPLVWGLREVLDYAEVLLNREDVDARAGAFIDFLRERVVDREFRDAALGAEPVVVRTFADLEQFFRRVLEHMEGQSRGGEVWRNHHLATIRKVRNRLGNISLRARGLVTDDGAVGDLPWGEFADRSLHVIDVAGLDPLGQDLVFTRVVSRLREHLERRDLGVDHLVVFVDELNKYAPADGPDTYVRRMLLDLSERGRYLGLVLFSAQQFRSQVFRRIAGNAGTSFYGRMDLEELATPGYATLSLATKARLAGLARGELLVRHPHFTHPLFIRFPRPAMLPGRVGVERFPPAPELPFPQAVARQLRALDPAITSEKVEALVDGRREEDVRRALHATRCARPDQPLAWFSAHLGRRVEGEVPTGRGVTGLRRGNDPYA